jgi:predicted DNA-binding helix-hairpin-helix protein
MNTIEKTRILGDSGKYDSCGPRACEVKVSEGLGGIYYAKAEHKTCKLFKTLMNNSCSFDCKYCPNASSKTQKAKYEPEELASLFNTLVKKFDVHGLFLSSGIASDPNKTTEEMIEAVNLVRFKYNFKGYVHFKILPGTSYDLIKQAYELSNRMSINIESPNKNILSELSNCKDYKIDILRRQSWISRLHKNQTTQLILNNMSTDSDVLKMMDWEYDSLHLKRIYFSAFRPIQGTALENEKPEKLSRQNHLYNIDFLRRDYGFSLKDFSLIMEDGMLPNEDPKLALAKVNFDGPVDINEANYEELIKIPGIGVKTARNILNFQGKIRKYEDLHNLGVSIERAKPFIEVNGTWQKSLNNFNL